MSSTESETFSPHNIAVLGGLLGIALFIGEVLIGPNSGEEMAVEATGNPLEELADRRSRSSRNSARLPGKSARCLMAPGPSTSVEPPASQDRHPDLGIGQ